MGQDHVAELFGGEPRAGQLCRWGHRALEAGRQVLLKGSEPKLGGEMECIAAWAQGYDVSGATWGMPWHAMAWHGMAWHGYLGSHWPHLAHPTDSASSLLEVPRFTRPADVRRPGAGLLRG